MALFKPLVPLISDAYAHGFSESIHISSIHAKYGSNHLEQELAASGAENNNCKNHYNLQIEQQLQVHIQPVLTNYDFSSGLTDRNYNSFGLFQLPAVLIAKFAPPPKFS